MNAPWGHKITVSAYFTGEPDDLGIEWAIDKLNEMWPDAEFIGLAVDEVRDGPNDQVAT
jgi:hypothetical protein